ncbi:hypothetical protein C8F04DRAFT_977306 [Mycena alexandri]|uniref:Uncharacterized protein n=1 Tax=Mycena alexandri TaxID=1745969 RepID=A0AAD6RZX9_9AGAR|nr:hypothetical protein C8F04DRAFT_977306 [Mycena alexandri]
MSTREALFIRDQDDQFIALLFSVPDEFKESLRRAIDHLNTVLNGEFTDKNSRDKAFKYLSIHYDWYARMPPKGHDAPKEIHPNNLGKAHGACVNMRQRVPYESKETLDKPEEYAHLADALTDFFTVISVSVRLLVAHLMPEDTKELKMYVDQLPLGASSPCYPFGGFVINIDSCTRAHRDPKDLWLCLIAHMGKHTGGQLGLYEVGLSFDLRLGNILVFPSWRLTHFNCHYVGKRATIVLHTDLEAKSWTKDGHGWSTYIVNHHRQAEEEQAGAGVNSSSDDED